MKNKEEPQELKELFLLGPDIDLETRTKELLQKHNDALLIGNGKDLINPKDIQKALQDQNLKIGPNTRIDINGHGNRKESKKHIISLFKNIKNTEEVFSKLKNIANNSPLYVHLWSCYGGSANKEVVSLGQNSILVTHIEAKEFSLRYLGSDTIFSSLLKHFDSQRTNPHQQFILDLPRNYEAAAFNQATAEGHKKFKFTRIPKDRNMVNVLQQMDKHDTLQGFINEFFDRNLRDLNSTLI